MYFFFFIFFIFFFLLSWLRYFSLTITPWTLQSYKTQWNPEIPHRLLHVLICAGVLGRLVDPINWFIINQIYHRREGANTSPLALQSRAYGHPRADSGMDNGITFLPLNLKTMDVVRSSTESIRYELNRLVLAGWWPVNKWLWLVDLWPLLMRLYAWLT